LPDVTLLEHIETQHAMHHLLLVLVIGLIAGILGGFFGVAGGVIIVPALIFLIGMPTQAAIGTSLGALLPPVGIFGAWVYWRQGALNWRYAAMLAVGLAIGAYFGAEVATQLSGLVLRRLFALLLLALAIRLFLPK
jgi:uncharacterized membrane protein YfcA